MIQVDISNIWGTISLPDLLGIEGEVFEAHRTLTEGTGEGADYLGWLSLPLREPNKEILRIQKAAATIRAESDVCVIVGIGGSYLGPRAGTAPGPQPQYWPGQGRSSDLLCGKQSVYPPLE